MARRRARLRPEYAPWYPQLAAGEWHDASWATDKVLQQHTKDSAPWSLGRRILSEAHFDFEGGDYRPLEGRERRRTPLYNPTLGTDPEYPTAMAPQAISSLAP
jgi:hypothetical protein